MKITIALGSTFCSKEGATQFAVQYANQLAQLDHDVSLVAPAAPVENIGRMQRWFKSPSTTPPANNIADYTELPLSVIESTTPLEDAFPPADILMATSCDTANWIAPLNKTKGTPIHFVQQYELEGEDFVPYMPSAYQLPMQTLTVSHWLADLLKLRHQTPVQAVVPFGIETVSLPRRRQPLRPTIGLKLDKSSINAFHTVRKAIFSLYESLPTLHVLIYGDSRLVDITGLPPDIHIEFYNHHDDITLQQLQAECDAWLYYHQAEPFATEVVNALAVGTPVVAITSGDTQIILANGGGIVVPIDDAKQMSTALYEICTLPESSWADVSQLAIKLAKNYSWENIGRKLHFALLDCQENVKTIT